MAIVSPIPDLLNALLEKALDKSSPQDRSTIEVGGTIHHVIDRKSLNMRALFEFSVQPNQIPAVIEQLRQKGNEASWVVFLFYTPNISTDTDDDCPALQYSIQLNMLGLDWVLLAQRNIADKVRIAAFITGRGHTVTKMKMNDVYYLRVEDGDIYGLGLSIVEAFYKMPRDADIGVLVSGFSFSFGGRYLH